MENRKKERKKKRASGLQDKEKRKKKHQLKDDGVGERREENENEEEQNHGMKHLGTKWGTKREEGKGQGEKRMQNTGYEAHAMGIHESYNQ